MPRRHPTASRDGEGIEKARARKGAHLDQRPSGNAQAGEGEAHSRWMWEEQGGHNDERKKETALIP
eukprot:691943-Pyramimonas_sp.AAC.1